MYLINADSVLWKDKYFLYVDRWIMLFKFKLLLYIVFIIFFTFMEEFKFKTFIANFYLIGWSVEHK